MFLTAAIVAASSSIGGAMVLALGTDLDGVQVSEPTVDGELITTGAALIDARAGEVGA